MITNEHGIGNGNKVSRGAPTEEGRGRPCNLVVEAGKGELMALIRKPVDTMENTRKMVEKSQGSVTYCRDCGSPVFDTESGWERHNLRVHRIAPFGREVLLRSYWGKDIEDENRRNADFSGMAQVVWNSTIKFKEEEGNA
jgi:hypothetical protein